MTYPNGHVLTLQLQQRPGQHASAALTSLIGQRRRDASARLQLPRPGHGRQAQPTRNRRRPDLHPADGDTLATSDGGDQYTGLDRFGRVVDQNWLNTGTAPATDRFQYGYDRDGNVLYKNNLVNSAFSELYHANSTTTGDNNTAYDPSTA